MVIQEDLIRKMVAEAIGTFILVLAGTGAAVMGSNYPLAFGFALIGIYYAIGHISGAHVNPAVTVGMAVVGRFPTMQVPYYVGAQVVGALVASLFLRVVHGNEDGLGANYVVEGYSVLDGFLLELVATAILGFVVVAVLTDKRVPSAAVGLTMGGTLLALELFIGPVTGASLNPARSLGPALASLEFADLWIFLTAPFIGAAIGAVGYEFIRGHDGSSDDRPVEARQRQRQPQQQPRRSERQQQPVADPNQAPRQRRPQRPAYDPDVPAGSLFDDEPLPQQQPQRQQRPPQQRQPQYDPEMMPFDDEPLPQRPQQQQRPPQRRRPPE